MIITISGKPGAGKSTVGKLLQETLNKQGFKFDFYSMGNIVGELAAKHGMTTEDFYERKNFEDGKKTVSIDDHIDNHQRNLGALENDFIIDSRLAFYFIPDGIHFFLDVKAHV